MQLLHSECLLPNKHVQVNIGSLFDGKSKNRSMDLAVIWTNLNKLTNMQAIFANENKTKPFRHGQKWQISLRFLAQKRKKDRTHHFEPVDDRAIAVGQ